MRRGSWNFGQSRAGAASKTSVKKKLPKAAATSALSIRQPFAELILRGIKKIEYRSILTHKRERVYIYASKVPVDDPGAWAKVKLEPGDLPNGVLVGTVEIVACTGEPGDYQWGWADARRSAGEIERLNRRRKVRLPARIGDQQVVRCGRWPSQGEQARSCRLSI